MEVVVSLLPWILIFGVFWFFLIRPQKKQQKQHQEMLDSLEVGDEIISAGGIRGKIIKIKDNVIRLRISPEVDIEIMKSSISQLSRQKEEAEEE